MLPALPFIHLLQRNNGAIILMYHNISEPPGGGWPRTYYVSPQQIKQQINYLLRHHYKFVSINEAIATIYRKGKQSSRTIALTFDDGYKNVYQNAFPVLREKGLPATIFLVTGEMGSINKWDEGIEAKEAILSWDEVKEMQGEKITFGSHTVSHPYLPSLRRQELISELVDSKAEIERELGQRVDCLAYPGGGCDTEIKKIAKQCGYSWGCLAAGSLNTQKTDPYSLKRIGVYYDDNILKYVLKIKFAFVFDILRYLQKQIRETLFK